MAKQVVKKIKLEIAAGQATPGQKLGPVLGQAGINIGEFVKKYNDATRDKMGSIIPCEISVYDDRSYDFVLKTSPASNLILKAIGKDKGSSKNLVSKAGVITKDQLRQVAEAKLADLNTNDIEQAMKIIAGSARSMGVEVK